MIKKYICDHTDRYHLSVQDNDSDFIMKIRELSASNMPYDCRARETFRKAIDNLASGKTASFERQNQYRLFFALGLNLEEANDLLSNYIHENELSARSLEEFLVICALKNNIKWIRLTELFKKYGEQINEQPLSPSTLCDEAEGTYTFQKRVLSSIKSVEDICSFLSIPENLKFFSILRNTHYLALTDYHARRVVNKDKVVKYEIIEESECSNGIPLDDIEQDRKRIRNYSKAKKTTMTRMYLDLFGLKPANIDGFEQSDSDNKYSPYLTKNEIQALARVFPNAFFTQQKFNDIIQRKCKLEPTQEVYLLYILETMPASAYSTYQTFINYCNEQLCTAGFTTMNSNYAFNRLIMDMYAMSDSKNALLSNCRVMLSKISENNIK